MGMTPPGRFTPAPPPGTRGYPQIGVIERRRASAALHNQANMQAMLKLLQDSSQMMTRIEQKKQF